MGNLVGIGWPNSGNPVSGWGMAIDGKGKSQRPMNKKGTVPKDGNVVSLGRDIQVKIGQHLRTLYDEVVKQGVPDQFNDLLHRLDENADKAKSKDKDRGE